jgi:membrane protease YdiL (CAAX protease family)
MDKRNPAGSTPTRSPLKSLVILASVTVLYTLYRYEGNSLFYLVHLNRSPLYMIAQARSVYFQRTMALLLLGIVPMIVVRAAFNQRLSEYGLTVRSPLVAILMSLLGILVVTPLTFFGSRDPRLAAIYPQAQNAAISSLLFWQSSFFSLLYYIGYEFCFRGFLYMGIREDVGDWQALGVSLLASVLLHVTQPQSETLLSIVAGVVFPLLVRRFRSIWPGVLIHAYAGISLDYWIIVTGGGFRAP